MMEFRQLSKQVFLYLIVGALATIVEWSVFYVLDTQYDVYYLYATAIAFIFSTFANWLFGRLIVFHDSKQQKLKEIGKIYFVSVIGLLLNMVIMYIAVERFGIHDMISKIMATGLVFAWNFLIRRFWIYRNKI